MEKAKFIKRIWMQMGKVVPGTTNRDLAKRLSISEHVISEHLSLIDDKTPTSKKLKTLFDFIFWWGCFFITMKRLQNRQPCLFAFVNFKRFEFYQNT